MNQQPTPARYVRHSVLALVLVAACLTLAAAPTLAHGEEEAAAVDLAATLGADYERVSGRIVQLAEAIPADKYGWRPAEGVRSVSEAVMHVATANFLLAQSLGVAPPDGMDVQGLEQVSDHDQVISTLKTSIEHGRKALTAAEGSDLNRTVTAFGFDMPVSQALVILDSHAHEHLGQLIAYARSNGVTPPWSQGE